MIGIYKIVNNKTDKFYIGSSIDIEKRWKTHINDLNKNKHHCIPLQRAWNKYGINSFSFEIIERCYKSNIINRENFYLKKLKPEYNIAKHALAPMTGRKHSNKTKNKMKKCKRPSGKDHYLYRTVWTKELRAKLIKARTGLKRSKSFKNKQSKNAKKLNLHRFLLPFIEKQRKKIKDNKGNTFKSLSEAAKYYKISIQAICDNLKGRSKMTRNKVIFSYVKS
jgi:group I intron endonuclease